MYHTTCINGTGCANSNTGDRIFIHLFHFFPDTVCYVRQNLLTVILGSCRDLPLVQYISLYIKQSDLYSSSSDIYTKYVFHFYSPSLFYSLQVASIRPHPHHFCLLPEIPVLCGKAPVPHCIPSSSDDD